MLKQKPKETQLTDEKVVQMRFVNHAVMQFIHSQRINLWWNTATRNNQCSEIFNAALLAVLKGDFKEAGRLRLKATFGFIKWPLIAGVIVGVCCSFIPFLWIVLAILLLMLVRRFGWLLCAEAEGFCNLLKRKMPKPDDQNWPFAVIPMNPDGGRYKRFMRGMNEKLPRCRFLEKAYSAFVVFRDAETEYAHLPVKNCVVCATMSAGKSTFVNALLGMDVLPARNDATTSKVTSVFDKDGADGLIGFAQNSAGEVTDVHATVDSFTIDCWNKASNISRVYLQGDLDGIINNGFKIAIHDTPGMDNSADSRHRDITKKALLETHPDVVVYVADVEKLCTTREKTLLAELFDDIVRTFSIPVLFVLNKADNINPAKEDISGVIARYKTFLEELGFHAPSVFPVSSKASRLVKMAINGHAGLFTETERDDFQIIVRRFMKRLAFDDAPQQGKSTTSAQIAVGDETYDANMLQTVLVHTGIKRIEVELEKLLTSNNKENK